MCLNQSPNKKNTRSENVSPIKMPQQMGLLKKVRTNFNKHQSKDYLEMFTIKLN